MNHVVKLGCLVCSLVISLNVVAEEKGFYVGGSLGYSSFDTESESELNAELAANGVTATSSIDDSDLGWKIFGGYNLNQYFGIELTYLDLGETKADITITAPAAGVVNANVDADGFVFAAVARYPINDKFDVFGKAGGFVWDLESTATSSLTAVTVNTDEDGTSIMFGLGAEYEIANNIGIRAEWERYEVSANDVDLFSIGFEYDF